MLVFCSARTRAQIESTRQAFGVFHPFVCESGAAAFVPERYFGSDVDNTRKVGGYQAIEFAPPYEQRRRHGAARRPTGSSIGVMGFNDMSVEQVARECGLSLLEARLAKLREYGEPFRLSCAEPGCGATAVARPRRRRTHVPDAAPTSITPSACERAAVARSPC